MRLRGDSRRASASRQRTCRSERLERRGGEKNGRQKNQVFRLRLVQNMVERKRCRQGSRPKLGKSSRQRRSIWGGVADGGDSGSEMA